VKATAFKHPNGTIIKGYFTPEFRIKRFCLKGNFQTNDKIEVTLTGSVGELGYDVFTSLKQNEDKKYFNSGFDFLDKNLSLNFHVMVPLNGEKSSMNFYTAAVGYYRGVSIGGEIRSRYLTDKFEFLKDNIYIQYDGDRLSGALFYKDDVEKGRRFGVGYFQEINEKLQSAIDITVNTQNYLNPLIRNSFTYKFDNYSTIRGRILQTGTEETKIGLVLKQTLAKNLILSTMHRK